MIIIVDANILFSAIITPNGKIAEILAYPYLTAKRVSCQFLVTEIYKHRTKIARYAKRTDDELLEDINSFLKHIDIYDEKFIQDEHLKEAKRLTSDVDLYDMAYVALALQTGGVLWTGDKKLISYLKSMGFDRVVNTAELDIALNSA